MAENIFYFIGKIYMTWAIAINHFNNKMVYQASIAALSFEIGSETCIDLLFDNILEDLSCRKP